MTDRPTSKEQHLRNQLGQHMLTHQKMLAEKKQMHADLVRQREDMQAVLNLLEMGTVKEAIGLLREALAWRERNRPQRKVSPSRQSTGSDPHP